MATGAAVRELAAPLPGTRALEGLYEAHAPDLRRRCLRLTRDADAADDLMQEVFVRFISRFPEPPAAMNVGAYLHATARNVLWKQLRDSHEVSDGDIETTVGADDDLDIDPERSALLGEQQNLVRRCAAVLTGRQRRALTLRDVEGRSYSEIGSELGIGTGAVMQVISRARARLRVAVRRANVDLDNLAPECKAMLGPLSDYLDGRASSTETEIESHLATCDDCCQTLASFQEAGSRLRGFLPLVPLGGLLSRFRGSCSLRGSQESALATVATTHAPTLARIGNALGAGGDGPLGITGVGAMVTAAVIAVGGGGIVVAEHVTSASGHARVASAPRARRRAGTAPAARTLVAGHRAPPRASRWLRRVTAGTPTPRGARRHPPLRPTTASTASQIGDAVANAASRKDGNASGPLPSEPATASREAPPAKPEPVRPPVLETPASEAPAAAVPAVVPVIKVPVVTTPIVPPPVVTVPTVPTTPVLPPILPPAIPLGASSSFGVVGGLGRDEHRPERAHGRHRLVPHARDHRPRDPLADRRQPGGRRGRAAGQGRSRDRIRRRSRQARRRDDRCRSRRPHPGARRLPVGLLDRPHGRADPRRAWRSQRRLRLPGRVDGHDRLRQPGRAGQRRTAVQRLLAGRQLRDPRNRLRLPRQHPRVHEHHGDHWRHDRGRVLARNGAVTLDSDVISRAAC